MKELPNLFELLVVDAAPLHEPLPMLITHVNGNCLHPKDVAHTYTIAAPENRFMSFNWHPTR
jgi:hypothetical protein